MIMREIKFEYGFESINGIVKKKYYLHEIPFLREKCDVWNVLPFVYSRQYTGLKDKNGAEIYEGDIVKHPLSTEPEHLGFIISFRDYRTTATNVFTKEESDFNVYFSNYDIIGNIHENPELLCTSQST